MLGHNVPKPLITGKFAREVREAARKSTATREEMAELDKQIVHHHTFTWVEQ